LGTPKWAAHFGATYVSAAEIASYAALVFAVGFMAGYVMLKTASLWGSFLFHAGADFMIIIPVLESLS
jgi:membrane protease YdiL (CAAX protease family)